MSKPAARMGDTTAHGGSIVKGEPTVLIGGMPAARVGDMHVCPMVNPGVPPPPHVGGPITLGSFTVLIGGQPAARVGDMCTCTGPPDTIAMGCMTVLIADGGGGGGGGGAGSGEGGTGDATGGAGAGLSAELEGEAEAENHYLDVKFVDKGGKPIAGIQYKLTSPDNKVEQSGLSGRIRKSGVEPGNYEIELKAITRVGWSVDEAEVGETVTLKAETAGIDDGEQAQFEVIIRDADHPDRSLVELESEVSGGRAEVEWELQVDDDLLGICDEKERRGRFSQPLFFFTVAIAGFEARSPMLRYKDYIEINLKDSDGNALGNRNYRLTLPSGEVRKGTLDANGHAREENIPPGKVKVAIDPRPTS